MMRITKLTLIFIVYEINLFAAEVGMPQLDPTYWASQAFWLILVFTILYISISKFYLPKIKNNLDNRENKIKEDLEAANNYKNLSELKFKEYEKILEDSKKEVTKIHLDSKNKLDKVAVAHKKVEQARRKREKAEQSASAMAIVGETAKKQGFLQFFVHNFTGKSLKVFFLQSHVK